MNGIKFYTRREEVIGLIGEPVSSISKDNSTDQYDGYSFLYNASEQFIGFTVDRVQIPMYFNGERLPVDYAAGEFDVNRDYVIDEKDVESLLEYRSWQTAVSLGW